MDWTRQIDAYCERLGPGLWAEPINALTNLAFLLIAAMMWRRVHGIGRLLCGVLFAIGVGSLLFHTVAEAWAGWADVVPILVFILIYLFSANRDFLGLKTWQALAVTLLFFPFTALATPMFRVLGLGSSASYAPVALLIAVYAVCLRNRAPKLARGLMIGAALLSLSLTARTLDGLLCDVWPIGIHFIWHLLNAVMLGWMIEVWRRHTLAGARPAR